MLMKLFYLYYLNKAKQTVTDTQMQYCLRFYRDFQMFNNKGLVGKT
jgi:hypothetical protein